MDQQDMFGNPIRKGDFISYPGRTGSSLFVNLAVYLKDKPNGKIQVVIPSTKWTRDDEGRGFYEETFRKTSVEILDRVIKIPDSFLGNDGMNEVMTRKSIKLREIQDRVLNNEYE